MEKKWYVTGESFAGRYVPALAYWILKNNDLINANKSQDSPINLQGIMLGDGYVDGLSQRVSEIGQAIAASLVAPYQIPVVKTLAVLCENSAAVKGLGSLDSVEACSQIPEFIADVSDIDPIAFGNTVNETAEFGAHNADYLNNPDVYKALNVQGSKKKGLLYDDFGEQSAIALQAQSLNNSYVYINYILTRIPCLIYEGNFDAKDGTYGAFEWVKNLAAPWPEVLNVIYLICDVTY